MKMKKNRLLELDAIRGIAALAVVFYHFFYRYNEIYSHTTISSNWSYIGKFGVQLFFIVSGFVIYWTLNRTKKPKDFIISRFSRLYPIFWFSVLITFITVLTFELPGRNVDFLTACLNLIMFHEYFNIKHVDGVYWTLTIELSFYFWIFILYRMNLLKRAEIIFLPLLLIYIANSQNIIELNKVVNLLTLAGYGSFFIIGICFYKFTNNLHDKYTLLAFTLSIITNLVCFSAKENVLFVCFYFLFYVATNHSIKILTIKPLTFLGSISYALYLLHQNIGFIIINYGYSFEFSPWLSIFIATVVTITLAFLATKYVEQPSITFIRQTFQNK